jgi:hypothetical protein
MQEVSLAGIPTKTIYVFPFSPMNAKQKTAVDIQRLGVNYKKDFTVKPYRVKIVTF